MFKKIVFLALLALIMVPVVAAEDGGVVCADSPATRLVNETEAQVAQVFSSLRTGINSSNVIRIMPGGAVLDILDGPYCNEGEAQITWWHVEYDGLDGYASEGANVSIWGYNQYWLQPVDDTDPEPEPGPCYASPETRLDGETEGQVAQVFSSIRAGIGSPDILKTMYAPAVFEILDGPVCAGPHYWYQVSYDGTTGWATEGYLDDYWLEPVEEE
jgi:hypothetical protein